MKNKNLYLTALTIPAVIIPVSTNAQDFTKDIEVSSNIGFYSDYVFRGISQSDKDFAVQGGFDASHDSGFYLGTWASNVNFQDDNEASAELDIYGGYGFSYKSFNVDLGAIYYAYPDADSDLNYDFYEVYAGVDTTIDKLGLGASVNYTPENFGNSGDATYLALTGDYALTNNLTLKSNIGYQMIDDANAFGTDDYLHWGLGLGYDLNGFDLSVKYSQSDLDTAGPCGSSCDPKVIFGLSREF